MAGAGCGRGYLAVGLRWRDSAPWRWARAVRYALPGVVGHYVAGPDVGAVIAAGRRCAAAGLGVTFGYFQGADDTPADILAANCALIAALRGGGLDAMLALKAPALGFDGAALAQIATDARAAGVGLMLDAHGLRDAQATLAARAGLGDDTGIALPVRWRRSLADATALAASGARIRLVKGEWADEGGDVDDIAAAYLACARVLAGRAAPVAVASHDVALAGAALRVLRAGATPVELEQLRGLPRRAGVRAAAALGVPSRIYLPFGPGWWPYAIDKACARPYLPAWYLQDRFG